MAIIFKYPLINRPPPSIPVMMPLVDVETIPEILIGRKGIFDRFDISFKEKDQKIIFRKRV